MSFQETVLIQFRASDNVSPTIASLNKALDSLGKNNAFRKLKTNLDLYIQDVDLWQKKLKNLEKTNPNLKANSNFQQVIADIEKLQKGFQIAKQEAESFEKLLKNGNYNEKTRQSIVDALKQQFNRSKDLKELFDITQQKVAPKGVPLSDEELKRRTTGELDDVLRKKDQLRGQEERKESPRHAKTVEDVMGEPNKPTTTQSTLDDKKSKKSKSESDEKDTASQSQTIKELNASFKLFNRLIQSVTSSLEKFNQALKGATGDSKNTKTSGSSGGNGGNGGGKGGGSKDGVPSDKFMDSLNHKFDDYKVGVASNAFKNINLAHEKDVQKASVGYTAPLPTDFQSNTQLASALNKGQQYQSKLAKQQEESDRLSKTVVPSTHGVVNAVNEMAKANEKFSTDVRNATKETDLSGKAQTTASENVANAVKRVTDASNRYAGANAEVGKSLGKVMYNTGNVLRSVDASKTGVVTPSYVGGAMYDAINSHSRSFDDMKGSMASLHSGKDTLQLGEEAIAKQKASQSIDAQTRKIALQSNIPDIDIQLKKLKENLVNASASPHKITLESNIPNVDAQLNKLRKDFNIPTTNALVPVNNQLGQVHNTVRNLRADSKSIPINVETQSASRNVMQIADNFNMLGQSLNMATGALTQFLSIVGSGNMVGDMLQYASLRQTNEVMLTARRGRAEAEKMYDSIQQLVIRLPGNDTFMTQILTMLGTMDKSLTTGDLNEIGNTISDYYMAAKAKGQFNNETERELRNYLMTGETRNLTNSVLASEIESLKDLDNIMDRTNALQKAMQKTGLDSIAHYNTYANKLEEFTGRFQKAFADLGDYLIMVVQPMMELFSLIDDITNSGASQAVLMLIGSILGVVSMISIAGMGVQILTYSVMGLASGLFILDDVKKKGIVTAILQNRQLDEESRARLRNTSIVQNGVRATITNTLVRIKEGAANIYVAMSSHILGNEKVREEAISKSLILTKLQSIYTSFSEILANTWEYLSLFRLRDGQIQYNMAKGAGIALKVREIRATITNTLNKIWEATVTFLTVDAENLDIIARVKNIAVKVAETVATLGLNIAMWGLIGASIVLDIVMSPITLTILAIVGAILLLIKGIEWVGKAFGWWDSIGGMFDAISSGIGRVWDAFMNSEPVQEIITTFQNFAYTIESLFNFIGSIGGGLWELIFGVGDGQSSGAFDIVGIFLEIAGAIGNFLYWLSPLEEILSIFDAIGSAIAWVLETWNDFVDSAEMQSLIKAFQDIRVIFGEAFGEIFEAFQEVGEAFGSIFEDNSSTEEATNGVNVLLELLKVLASIIKTVVIPPLKAVADTVKWIADGIKWVADGVAWLEGKESPTAQKPQNIANTNGGYNSYYTDLLSGGASYDYSQTQGMTQSYNYNDTQKTSSVFNIFNEGSVQADARNMSAKDVQKMFTGAFGYNKARGTEGILN